MSENVLIQFLEGQERRREYQNYLDSLLRWSPKYQAELNDLVADGSGNSADVTNPPKQGSAGISKEGEESNE